MINCDMRCYLYLFNQPENHTETECYVDFCLDVFLPWNTDEVEIFEVLHKVMFLTVLRTRWLETETLIPLNWSLMPSMSCSEDARRRLHTLSLEWLCLRGGPPGSSRSEARESGDERPHEDSAANVCWIKAWVSDFKQLSGDIWRSFRATSSWEGCRTHGGEL